jgi:hypothetical protein
VANVEQTRLLARPVVRIDNAHVAVLHGHLVASERHKFGSILGVKLIQARPAQLALGSGSGRRGEADGRG